MSRRNNNDLVRYQASEARPGMVIGVGSILTIVLLVVAALTFGMSAANYHGNLVVMMFSIVGIVISRLVTIAEVEKTRSCDFIQSL